MELKKIEILFFSILLLLGLNGCKTKTDIKDTVKSNSLKVSVTYKEEPTETVSDNNMVGAQQKSDSYIESGILGEEYQGVEDYKKLIRKIWILEEGETVGDYRYSFVFTKIEGDMIEGRLRAGANIIDSFISSDIYEERTKSFTGFVNNGEAICNLADKTGNIGTIKFQFYENDRIEAKLDYVTILNEWDIEDTEKSYLFRPYTINDCDEIVLVFSTEMDSGEVKDDVFIIEKDSFKDVRDAFIIDENEKVSFISELNSFGEMKFVSGVIKCDTAFYPVLFITNDKDEVYYKIHLTNGFEIKEVVVKDTNGDGLKDITIILYSPDSPEAFQPIWVFNQTRDGMFYKDESDKRYMNPED